MKMASTYYSFVFSYHLVHEEREGASTYITLHIMIIPLPFSCENSFIWSIYIFSKATHRDVLLGFFFSTNFQFRYGQSTLVGCCCVLCTDPKNIMGVDFIQDADRPS